MTKKPALWIALAVLAIASAALSWRYFTRAFPLLSLDIRMDRQEKAAEATARTARPIQSAGFLVMTRQILPLLDPSAPER